MSFILIRIFYQAANDNNGIIADYLKKTNSENEAKLRMVESLPLQHKPLYLSQARDS